MPASSSSMIKAAQPGRAGTVGSTIVHLSIYRQRRGLRWRPFLSQLLTHHGGIWPTSSSLADDKAGLLAPPQHGGARFPTLAARSPACLAAPNRPPARSGYEEPALPAIAFAPIPAIRVPASRCMLIPGGQE